MKQLSHGNGNQNQNDHVQSWYPVSRCCDLKNGQHKAVKLLDQEWILFRTVSGKVSFLARHCCHMGADLCQGHIINESIQCPLHAWEFDINGHCVHIPDYTKPLPERKIRHLVCEEKYGLIFVFWGEKPLFSIPSPPNISPQQVFSLARVKKINTHYKIFSLNSFDTQHFKHVHSRTFVKKPEIYPVNAYALRINFEAKIIKNRWVDHVMSWLQKGNIQTSIECWGGNLLTLMNHDLNSSAFVALQPLNNTQTTCYLVSIKTYQVKPSLFDRLSLSIAATLFQSFLIADLKPTKNMRLHQAGLLDDIDYGAKTYWEYFHQLPRLNIRSNEASD